MSDRDNEEKPPMAAIEYSSDRNEGLPIPSQPRPPRNLQDLLRYSTEAANALSGTTTPDLFRPMDEESKEFLNEAIKSLTIDVVQELLKSIKILQNASTIPEDGDPTKYEVALDNIIEFVDDVYYADNFHKIGGFCVLKPCLESGHSSLRWRGAELVAELCQNNPYCQKKVLETGLMPSLLKMVDSDVEDTVRIKALYAVSCIVRDNEEGLEEFMKTDGFSVLLRALQTDLEKLNLKSAFLLSSLCHWKPQIKDELVSMGYVEQLISQLSAHIEMSNEGHPPSLEHLLRAVYDILQEHESAQEIARTPELQFKNILDFIVKNSNKDDRYEEENEHAKNLIRIVFGESERTEMER